MPAPRHNWLVVALSAAGVIFILLGLLALALPTSQEGIHVWQLDSQHAIYLMDVAGSFAIGLGVVLTWLGGKLWNRQLMA
ncbi:MAG: hypothetical protein MUQ30_01155 [Anaerolineae bacterium]|nr:hypothetical protein [Anaerolineae bacterium]